MLTSCYYFRKGERKQNGKQCRALDEMSTGPAKSKKATKIKTNGKKKNGENAEKTWTKKNAIVRFAQG